MSKECPACNTKLSTPQAVEINQQVVCPHCDLKLEVVWLYPLEFSKVSGSDLEGDGEKSEQTIGAKRRSRIIPAEK